MPYLSWCFAQHNDGDEMSSSFLLWVHFKIAQTWVSCTYTKFLMKKKQERVSHLPCALLKSAAVRPDPSFDGLIAQIYPNLDEFEAKEDRLIEQINEKFKKSGSLMNIEQGEKTTSTRKER